MDITREILELTGNLKYKPTDKRHLVYYKILKRNKKINFETNNDRIKRTREAWPKNYGWILEEYSSMREEMKQVTSTFKSPEKQTDFSATKPRPQSTNHEYGWISTKPEFALEKYGPDVPKIRGILEEHKIDFDASFS